MKGSVNPGLQEYLASPALVEGWVTDQAVVLRGGTMRLTMYFTYGSGCAILRCTLPPDHPESELGLWQRFDAGERYVPDPSFVQVTAASLGEHPGAGPSSNGARAAPRMPAAWAGGLASRGCDPTGSLGRARHA